MAQGIKDTVNETFEKLMGNSSTFEVPQYQRDYSWTEEQWSDLWYDILQMRENSESHYMGYLVLQSENEKKYKIIDGQQRLTTLCILTLAVIKLLRDLPGSETEKENNEKRAKALTDRFIGHMDVITLISENKLILNRNNNNFYREYLTSFRAAPLRGLKVSEKLLKQAFEYFYEQFKESCLTSEELVSFHDTIVCNLFFTVITVSDELNAFKVFETLNARGVQLSSSDLLKNYIFSIANAYELHDTKLNEIEKKWTEITGILRESRISDFLRIYWNSTHKTIRKMELYRTIRNEIRTPEQAFALLWDLKEKADIYVALKDPHDELWREDAEIADNLALLKLFNVVQPFPLLLTAYSILDKKEFKSLLSKIVRISFRYNVICGKNPNEQETVYNKIALSIISDKRYNVEDLKRGLYIPDEEFEKTFSYREFTSSSRNNKIARYILCSIENYDTGACINEDTITLEHILPDSPDERWNWDDAEIQRYRYRLGNMTLLEGSLNKEKGNAPFSEKKAEYRKSAVGMTRALADIDEWTKEQIEKRQHKMAQKAKGIWSL